MLTIEGEENEETKLLGIVEMEEQQGMENLETSQLSLHALVGTYSYQTMRIRGNKGTKTLFLIIDTESSHKFLGNRLAKQFGCVLESISTLKVTAANGNELYCREVCKQFLWGLQGHQFSG